MDTVVVGRNALERAIVVVCSVMLWVTTAVIFVILAANTLLRYASGSSLQWANEVPELLFPWLVMAGVVLASEKGEPFAGRGRRRACRLGGSRPGWHEPRLRLSTGWGLQVACGTR